MTDWLSSLLFRMEAAILRARVTIVCWLARSDIFHAMRGGTILGLLCPALVGAVAPLFLYDAHVIRGATSLWVGVVYVLGCLAIALYWLSLNDWYKRSTRSELADRLRWEILEAQSSDLLQFSSTFAMMTGSHETVALIVCAEYNCFFNDPVGVRAALERMNPGGFLPTSDDPDVIAKYTR